MKKRYPKRTRRLERWLRALPDFLPDRHGPSSRSDVGLRQLGPVKYKVHSLLKPIPYWQERYRVKSKPKGPNGEWTAEQMQHYEENKRRNVVRHLRGAHGNFGGYLKKGEKHKITLAKISINEAPDSD